MKDQLKKKPLENDNYHGKLRSDPSLNLLNDGHKDTASAPKPSPKSSPALTDSDWTQLLSTPNQPTASGSNRSNGVTAVRGLNKNNRRLKNLSSNLLVSETKRNQKSGNNASKSSLKLDTVRDLKLSGKGKASDGEESTSSSSADRHSNVESETDGKQAGGQELGRKNSATKHVVELNREENEASGPSVDYSKLPRPESLQSVNKNQPTGTLPVSSIGKVQDAKTAVEVAHDQSRSTNKGKNGINAVSGSSISDDLKRVSPVASDVSDSDTDFSSSDSESEREREERKRQRARVLAEKAAAKAIEAIKEREDMVAKLEGEKQSLEKIIEERAKQQAQEVTSLLCCKLFSFLLLCTNLCPMCCPIVGYE